MKSDGNPMDPVQRLQNSARCHAKAKSTGDRCNAPAVRGKAVCRMHGAGGGAPFGPANGAWKHGGRTAEAMQVRRIGTALARMARDLCGDL